MTLDWTKSFQNTKSTILLDKLDFIKIQNFCISKYSIEKMRRQATVGENVNNHTCDKRLVSRIYTDLLQLNKEKINNAILKWTKDSNRHFPKEDIRMVNNHLKRCLTLLVIRETQIKVTLRHLNTSSRIVIIKTDNTK